MELYVLVGRAGSRFREYIGRKGAELGSKTSEELVTSDALMVAHRTEK